MIDTAGPPMGVRPAGVTGRAKPPLHRFLAANPFGHTFTDGLFYREKMRAIHRIAPDERLTRVLEIGGGRSGLTALLYPQAAVVNVDVDPSLAASPPNRRAGVTFVCASAVNLPFKDAEFDAVTMFDLLEHVPDDITAAREALRVLRPGGVVLVSTPHHHWRYPWYGFMRPLCPDERTLFRQWGHVRRGYSLDQLAELFRGPPDQATAFINPLTALAHDIAFSSLGRRARLALHLMAAPLSAAGWLLHERLQLSGTEIAARWRKPA